MPTTKAGTVLGLSDFFEPPSSWVESRYEVADQADVLGISTEVTTSSEAQPEQLELRLANKFNQLDFVVGQANDSRSSSETLVVQVLGNDKQLDVQRVPFNTLQPISVTVTDVNAVKINLYLEPGGSLDGVDAVISDIVVE